jgi:hypothetical protein
MVKQFAASPPANVRRPSVGGLNQDQKNWKVLVRGPDVRLANRARSCWSSVFAESLTGLLAEAVANFNFHDQVAHMRTLILIARLPYCRRWPGVLTEIRCASADYEDVPPRSPESHQDPARV